MTGQFQLTQDQRAIQQMAQRFTADNITPHAGEEDEKHHFPRGVIRRTGDAHDRGPRPAERLRML